MARWLFHEGTGMGEMARPRIFDENAVLTAAAECFRAHGYEATSVRDLIQAMGLTGPSLYNAFGDKRALYRRALDHYVECNVGERVRRLETNHPPRAAIDAFFTETIESILADPDHKGCLLVNSTLESTPEEPELQQAITARLELIEHFFRRCVTDGQQVGTITRAQPPEDLACLLLVVLLGLRVLARARSPDRAFLEGVVRPALLLLAPPAETPA